jgi:hypothetical protein
MHWISSVGIVATNQQIVNAICTSSAHYLVQLIQKKLLKKRVGEETVPHRERLFYTGVRDGIPVRVVGMSQPFYSEWGDKSVGRRCISYSQKTLGFRLNL